eukprot:11229373-Alexandrium_andersonii.AAC.1
MQPNSAGHSDTELRVRLEGLGEGCAGHIRLSSGLAHAWRHALPVQGNAARGVLLLGAPFGNQLVEANQT